MNPAHAAPTTSSIRSPRPPRPARSPFFMVVPPVAFLALALIAATSLLWGGASGAQDGPVAHMSDVAAELGDNIRSAAGAGLEKTKALANDPRLPAAIKAHDRAAGEQLANDMLRGSLELDIVAIFDGEGLLLAVNTVHHDGSPVPAEALDRLYSADFSQRGVIQGCLRDTTSAAQMEFQTKCDFTPPFFGSSGLSVAFSAPVPGAEGGAQAGVVSTRLNFKRITNLIRENAFVRAGNGIYLVSDSGGFFDEDINSGRVAAPLSHDELDATLREDASQSAGNIIVHCDDKVLMGRRVQAAAIDGGGINVVLRAREEWVRGEEVRAKRLAGGALLGSLVAAGMWGLYLMARTGQHKTQTALTAERARTALILENLGECVLSTDASGHVRFANPAACKALGYAPDTILGLDFKSLFAEGGPASLNEPWSTEQATIRRRDGSSFQARVTCTVLPESAGGVIAFNDLTEKLATDRQLLDATRRAGMAEVATGVLHNVGNVLNSVNVAACVVASKLKHSEIPNLVKAGDMMHEHRTDLHEYLKTDERGKHLPEYLIEVARTLGAEQQSMLDELDAVTKGIEHVKHVVNLQQEHAKKSSVAEPIRPVEVMEAAVQLQIDSLNRHGVNIERRFETMPVVTADKHLVLQILVNLIANARQAMHEIEPGKRRLTLVARTEGHAESGLLHLEVHDNGVGIPQDNLRRIFGQGFTTKKDGHGFGLHSAANAAKQMGGSLSATSDGPGTGSRFILSIPLTAKVGVPVHADR